MSAAPSPPGVLVAHDAAVLRESMRVLLDRAGYPTRAVADGHAALAALAEPGAAARIGAVVLDVAIGGRFAWEIVDAARATGPRTILVASVYSRTSYKRRPSSLHGADDYIEQHHIPDSLVAKVARLIGPGGDDAAPFEAPAVHGDTDEDRAIRDAGEARLVLQERDSREGLAHAQRLARLIVADVALYNGDALARGDLGDPRLGRDLAEGRLIFDSRVPEEIRRGTDFITEAVTEWQHRKTTSPERATGGMR